jgi:hypothetical protein
MGPASDNSKVVALLGYIFAPLGLIALALDPYKDEVWVRLHVWQGAALWLVGFVVSFITFGLGWILVFIYQIILAVQVYQGKSPQVPVIYGMVKGLAKAE